MKTKDYIKTRLEVGDHDSLFVFADSHTGEIADLAIAALQVLGAELDNPYDPVAYREALTSFQNLYVAIE